MRFFPALLFLLTLSWRWHNWDLQSLPAYGDPLEVVWGLEWYRDAFVEMRSPLFTPLLFHPEGWHTATFAHSPYFFITALPLHLLGGPAFAYNIVALSAVTLAFGGMYRLARLLTSRGPATMAALSYAFSYPLFVRLETHLNVLGGLALLPWLLWTLWQARQRAYAPRWLLAAGLLWGVSISFSFYFLFLGGLVVLLFFFLSPALESPSLETPWLIRHLPAVGQRALAFLYSLFLVGSMALLLSLPLFILFWQGRAADQTATPDLSHLNLWGASLNSLFIPSLQHPLLSRLAAAVYSARLNEPAMMSLGIVMPLLAFFALLRIRPDWRTSLLLALSLVGILLGLGVYLKWNDAVVTHPLLRPLNHFLWQTGHWLKPHLFPSAEPPAAFAGALPLPEFWLVLLVPLWEGARTTARYLFLALLALPLLAALALDTISSKPLRLLLMGLWLLEILPPQLGQNLPPLPAPHPAYSWLAQQSLTAEEGVVDLRAGWLAAGGEIALATRYHGKPTVAGVGSQFPADTAFFDAWYRDYGATDPAFPTLLQAFGVRYLLLHMVTAEEYDLLPQLEANSAFRPVRCFQAQSERSPWYYPICVLEVVPAENQLNVAQVGGWYSSEPWGVWAGGEESEVRWVATSKQNYYLHVEAFPHCLEGQQQQLLLEQNGNVLAQHAWSRCETWQETIEIPARLVEVGWNMLALRPAYTISPAEATHGENADQRSLSVGFSRLEVTQRP